MSFKSIIIKIGIQIVWHIRAYLFIKEKDIFYSVVMEMGVKGLELPLRNKFVKNHFIITIDVDWAPDWALEITKNLLIEFDIKSTWFLTHKSKVLNSLRNFPELFELGIHPNFLPNSSHGETIKEVLVNVLKYAPEAVSMRSHAVFQSGPLFEEVIRYTPIKIDSSIFLPEMPNIRPVKHLSRHGYIWRVPFFWADDYEMMKSENRWNFKKLLSVTGLKVLMFHPIHVALNTDLYENYEKLKKMSFNSINKDEIKITNSNVRIGSKTFFTEILNYIKTNCLDSFFLKESLFFSE